MLTTAETNLKMGTAYFADLVQQFGGAHYALATYNAGPEPRRALDCRAAGHRPRRVHRRHPVSGDAELREENPRHGRRLSRSLRRRSETPTSRTRPSAAHRRGAQRSRRSHRVGEERPRRRRKKKPARAERTRKTDENVCVLASLVESKLTYVEAHRIEEGHAVHRVGHPRDDAAESSLRRREPVAGVSGLPGARRRSRTRPAPPSTAT